MNKPHESRNSEPNKQSPRNIFENFSCSWALENFSQSRGLRTDISQKTVVGCPCVLKAFGILKSYTKIHTADLHHFITGNGLETKISRTFLDFYHFRARILRHFRPILCPACRAYQTHLASRSACRACQTGRADRRVTSNNPRNNRETHFSSSPLLVTKVAN